MGTAATMVIGGYLIHYLGWSSLFYSVGVLSIIWFILWSFLVFSSPSDHPSITREELEYIESAIGGQTLAVLDDFELFSSTKSRR